MTVTLHVLTPSEVESLEALVISATAKGQTKTDLEAVAIAAGYSVPAFLEVYDRLVAQGRIWDFREVT